MSIGNTWLDKEQTRSLTALRPQRIVIMRALPGLGDMLCVIPAWHALRAALPEAHVTLIGLPWAKNLVQRFGAYLDSFLEFPGYPGLPEQTSLIQRLPTFLAEVQAQSFDLAIQMHGSGIVTNPFTILLGARVTAGFFLPGQYCPNPCYFLPYPAHEPEIRCHLQLMEFLGVPSQGETLVFPLDDSDWQAFSAIAEVDSLQPGRYVCLHAGASTFERCWPPERFAAVGDELTARGWQVVLTGSAKETELTQAVSRMMRASSLNLAGRTSLGALAVLLSRASLLICNDTGVSHLAAALQVPSVVIFTQSDPDRWAPLDRERHRVVHPFPAVQADRETEMPPTQVSVEMVLAEVEHLLNQKVGEAL